MAPHGEAELGTVNQEVVYPLTCLGAADENYRSCIVEQLLRSSSNLPYSTSLCASGRTNAQASCASGSIVVYRILSTDWLGVPGTRVTHRETTVPETTAGTVEGVFRFAQAAQPGAPSAPLYRCSATAGYRSSSDSVSRSCANIHSLTGYTYAPNTPGTSPVYACSSPVTDSYLSRSAACEGATVVEFLGWAR